MAIDDLSTIDGMGIDAEGKCLRLLLTDHLEWQQGKDTLNEYDHLLLLQEKINAYLSYLEAEQYKEQYPDTEFEGAIIEIHFKYDIAKSCEKLLQTVQDQIGQYGIMIKAHIG